MNFIIYFQPFLTRIKQIYAHKCILTKLFQLCANDSHFAQSIYLIDKTDKIPCAILEWSDTILELRNQVGILTLRRAILEWDPDQYCQDTLYCCYFLGRRVRTPYPPSGSAHAVDGIFHWQLNIYHLHTHYSFA